MLDKILIILIFLIIVLFFLKVKAWKKRYFVKEIYISEGASSVFFVITIVYTIGILIIYCISTKESPYSWLCLTIVLISDLITLIVFSILATTCIFLKDNILIKKNIIYSKQILLNKETKIIEKFDKTVIKYRKKTIAINFRYLTVNINNLMNNVKTIINE